MQLRELMHPHGNLPTAQFIAQDQIAAGFLRLVAQRLHLQLQFGDFIVDTQQVFLRALELAFAVLLAVTELGNARRLFKHAAALGAFHAKQLVDLALADDGITLMAQARVHKQLVHVAQPHSLTVDVIFTFAAAVIASGHGDFAFFHGENAAGIINDQCDLGKPYLGALLRSAENHVLHFAATQSAGALLPHNPANSIGNIGLAAAVGTNDGSDILGEIQNGFVRERLKALDFERLQIHGLCSPQT